MLELEFKTGDRIVYRGHGIGTIVGSEMKGSGAQTSMCLIIEFPSTMKAFVPVDSAHRTLRHLSSKAEAESDLAILRSEGVEPDNRHHRAKTEERERTLRTGTREEIAELLRRLYAARTPVSSADAAAIRALEDLVLGEISIVLAVPREELEREMRERYGPVSTEKKRAH